MNIETILEVNLHKEDEISFDIKTNTRDREEKIGELILLSSFIIRTLWNLAEGPYFTELCNLLSLNIKGEILQMVDNKNHKEPSIINPINVSCKKKFIANLIFSNERFTFDYKVKGFQLFSSKVEEYAINSVKTLLRYLVKNRKDDKEYISALENITKQCALIFINDEVTKSNHGQQALTISFDNFEYGYLSPHFALNKKTD